MGARELPSSYRLLANYEATSKLVSNKKGRRDFLIWFWKRHVVNVGQDWKSVGICGVRGAFGMSRSLTQMYYRNLKISIMPASQILDES